jgi:DNA adenine methylase Dam
MAKMTADDFLHILQAHAATFAKAVATNEGAWIIKGFIDIYERIYTISVDTKIVSKVLELLLFPMFVEFGKKHGLKVELCPQQNFYPDLTFTHESGSRFAVDIKSTYRINKDEVNGMTLGAFTGYFRERESKKNTLYPYGMYAGHFVLGVLYAQPSSLDFIFLNRSCFNGVMRFNRQGRFNVPYCHKKDRFAQAYVTKIINQIRRIGEVISVHDWTFQVADFRQTLGSTQPGDFVYADPPYAGRHVDYFNSWSEADEGELARLLKAQSVPFILSTWHSNEFRKNLLIEQNWSGPEFHVLLREHFYHVGSSEDLRHPMVEALITNFRVAHTDGPSPASEQLAFFERA